MSASAGPPSSSGRPEGLLAEGDSLAALKGAQQGVPHPSSAPTDAGDPGAVAEAPMSAEPLSETDLPEREDSSAVEELSEVEDPSSTGGLMRTEEVSGLVGPSSAEDASATRRSSHPMTGVALSPGNTPTLEESLGDTETSTLGVSISQENTPIIEGSLSPGDVSKAELSTSSGDSNEIVGPSSPGDPCTPEVSSPPGDLTTAEVSVPLVDSLEAEVPETMPLDPSGAEIPSCEKYLSAYSCGTGSYTTTADEAPNDSAAPSDGACESSPEGPARAVGSLNPNCLELYGASEDEKGAGRNHRMAGMKPPGGESHDLWGAEFKGTPCHHRVLKPPGGGSSDIFGTSEPLHNSPRRVRNNLQSSVFGPPATNEDATPRNKPGMDSYNRLFGPADSRPQSATKNRLKSNIFLSSDGTSPKKDNNSHSPGKESVDGLIATKASMPRRNPVTGDGMYFKEYRRSTRKRDGNPVTGEGYANSEKQPSPTTNGQVATNGINGGPPSAPASAPNSAPAQRNRVPPGGFSSGLW